MEVRDLDQAQGPGPLALPVILKRGFSPVCFRAVVQEIVHHLIERSKTSPQGAYGFRRSEAEKGRGEGEGASEQLSGLSGDVSKVFLFLQDPALAFLLGNLPRHRSFHRTDEDLEEFRATRLRQRPGRRQ